MLQSRSKTVLLTLGRLPIALDVARSFANKGWRVVVAEPFAMNLLRMSKSVERCYQTRAPVGDKAGYLADLRRIIAAESVELVVPVSEETMHVAALVNDLDGDGVTVFGVEQSRTLALHDKLLFNQMAERFELPVPRSLAGEDVSCDDITGLFDYVVKPRLSCSGRGVRYFSRGETATAAPDSVVQEKISGQEFSSFSIAQAGQVIVTVVYRSRANSGSVAVVFERVERSSNIDQWVADFVQKTGHTGFISFDFIVDEHDTAFAIECNPRATSGIHFVTTNDLADAISKDHSSSSTGLRSKLLLQEGYSSYTALLGSLFDSEERNRRFALLREARDVTWLKTDPWPFLLMSINTYRLIWLAVVKRKTFAEVAVLDIEWTRA